jgi:energy-converting hydrogenase Eha subunit H
MSMNNKILISVMAAGAGGMIACDAYGFALFSSLICLGIIADSIIEALKK